MKKILIIGATGSFAQYVIEVLKPLEKVELTLFVRNKKRLSPNLHINCLITEGDALQYNSVIEAVDGKDLVLVNLVGNLESMAKNIVKAMVETGVKRIIVISSIGIYDHPLKPVLIPYRRLADIIEASGLDYTILRLDWFTHADEINYTITQKGEPETGTAISRKSISAFIATLVENPKLHKIENSAISKPN